MRHLLLARPPECRGDYNSGSVFKELSPVGDSDKSTHANLLGPRKAEEWDGAGGTSH